VWFVVESISDKSDRAGQHVFQRLDISFFSFGITSTKIRERHFEVARIEESVGKIDSALACDDAAGRSITDLVEAILDSLECDGNRWLEPSFTEKLL
jgi:hypothetical protein